MRKILIIVLSCTFLSACGNDQWDDADKHVRDIVNNYDWSKDVPLDPMVRAYHECEKYPDISWCLKLHNQLMDISASYESCKLQSPQSRLCGIVVYKIKDNTIRSVLPTAEALSLPDNPFYFWLPTKLLDENASGNRYRYEMLKWWIRKYQSLLNTIIFGATIFLILWAWFIYYRREKAKQAEIERNKLYQEQEAAKQKLLDDKLKKSEQTIDDKQKIAEENAAQKQQAELEKTAEQNRQRDIQRAKIALQIEVEKQKADEAEEREAAEKKFIKDMMKAAVKKSPKKK